MAAFRELGKGAGREGRGRSRGGGVGVGVGVQNVTCYHSRRKGILQT